MLKWLNGLIDRIFVVAGAVLFSQAPHFLQHYTQRLGGHVAELRLQIEALRLAAEKSGKSVHEYVQKFLSQTDLDFTYQGEVMRSMFTRYTDLDQAYFSLIHSTVFTRPFVFLKHLQLDIAKMTLADFTFGVTLTVEALLYALAGMGFGYFVYRVLSGIVAKVFHLFKKSPRQSSS
jgi:hypothetical protein